MAKIYFEKLSNLINQLKIENSVSLPMEVKHFFSGAALYIDETICVSWSPAGLAFKLSETKVTKLISSGQAKELKYFPKGHVKKGYVLFENPEDRKSSYWKKYIIMASQQV